jgi:hypothetical protein
MRANSISTILFLLFWLGAATPLAVAQNQAHTPPNSRADAAVIFNYVHSNTPVDGCGCFGLYGVGASGSAPLGHSPFSAVVDFTWGRNGKISSQGFELNQTSLTGGLRYRAPALGRRIYPFGQVTAGFAHASGSLVENPNGPVSNAGAAFAATAGGGLDYALSHHIWIRFIQADYLVTTFHNGGNDHQNDARLGAGLVLRF